MNAASFTLRNSTVNGRVYVTQDDQIQNGALIEDVLINRPGAWSEASLWANNTDVRRTEINGGAQSMSCKVDCLVEDSWFHGQGNPPSSADDVHGDGFLANEAHGITLRHNTLACDMPADGGGACSAALALYGDWGWVENVTVDGNLFKASPAGYCAYGGELRPGKPYGARNVDFINNVFERSSTGHCGVWGAVSNRATDAASSWSNNRYADNGQVVQ